jgi:2-oxoisovalerate dehydrogenase E1 component
MRSGVGKDALIQEANSRNRALKDAVKRGVEGQSDLPPIWGADWQPRVALVFSKPLSREVIRSEILRFVTERWEGHLNLVASVLESNLPTKTMDGDDFHNWSELFSQCLYEAFDERLHDLEVGDVLEMEIIPRRDGRMYLSRRRSRFILDIRLTLRRLAYSAAVTLEQRLKWHRWMIRTKILDGHLKNLFVEGVETPDGARFGGKGFRSTWQEAVAACGTAIEIGTDFAAPMIRDLGLALSLGQTPLSIMAAQMGKSESKMNGGHVGSGGRDLHIGDWSKGILPPTAPLPIASATITGMALASKRLGVSRFHLAPVGEGCSSSGEFWEAINLAGVRGLPICYVIQNNQIALDTFSGRQSGAETFGDKGVAVGLPSWTIDGSDPSAYHASVAVARELAISGGGGSIIHVETMRGCGHAHHHDDLYLGTKNGNPPGYVDRKLMNYWAEKEPISNHEALIRKMGASARDVKAIYQEETALCESARSKVEAMPWPNPESAVRGVTKISNARTHNQQLAILEKGPEEPATPILTPMEFSDASNAWTFSKAIQSAMVDIAERSGDLSIFMGEDMEVAGAFGLNLALKARGHEDKLLDMPLSESIIINSATGAAMGGLRPVAEIQFGGFAALAMNALVNNAAQLRWRWGADVPMTVRIPLGGKTRSGPFHANMIESWLLNDPGLLIGFPSNPQDAYDLLLEGDAADDPFILLEHIGLYGLRGGLTGWGDRISQSVDTSIAKQRIETGTTSIGKARITRSGRDVTIVTWGAMVHVAMNASNKASKEGIEVEVIDLRTLHPLDVTTCIESVNRTGRLIVLQEAQWTGGFGHTVCSSILEGSFWSLEGPPVVIGALDTPVPFSPPLEDYTLPDSDLVAEHIRRMV